MSASLTGQLAYMALLTAQLHFQLVFFNSPRRLPPPHPPFLSLSLSRLAQRPSVARQDPINYPDTFALAHNRTCAGRERRGQGVLFKVAYAVNYYFLQDLWNMLPSIGTAEHNSFAHKSSAPQHTGPA